MGALHMKAKADQQDADRPRGWWRRKRSRSAVDGCERMTNNAGDEEPVRRAKKKKTKKKEECPPGKGEAGIRIEEAPDASIAMDAASSIMPGLMGLVEGLTQTGPFQQRMKEIDEELKKRLKEEEGRGKRPHLDYSFSVRTLHDGAISGRPPSVHGKQAPRRPQQPRQVRVEKTDLAGEDRLVDIVEMTEELLVLVELRGLDEKDIHLDLLNDQVLLLLAKRDGVEVFRKEIPLPAPVAKKLSSDSRNGILTVRLRKKGR